MGVAPSTQRAWPPACARPSAPARGLLGGWYVAAPHLRRPSPIPAAPQTPPFPAHTAGAIVWWRDGGRRRHPLGPSAKPPSGVRLPARLERLYPPPTAPHRRPVRGDGPPYGRPADASARPARAHPVIAHPRAQSPGVVTPFSFTRTGHSAENRSFATRYCGAPEPAPSSPYRRGMVCARRCNLHRPPTHRRCVLAGGLHGPSSARSSPTYALHTHPRWPTLPASGTTTRRWHTPPRNQPHTPRHSNPPSLRMPRAGTPSGRALLCAVAVTLMTTTT